MYLSDELPATDSLVLAQCHVCQHWHKSIIPSQSLPQPGFPFSEALINQKIQQFTLVLHSREALHSPLELSSTGFLFSRDSPVADKSFTEISRSQVGGSTTQHGAEVFPWPRSHDTPTAVYLLLPGLDGSCPQSVHTRTDWPRGYWKRIHRTAVGTA